MNETEGLLRGPLAPVRGCPSNASQDTLQPPDSLLYTPSFTLQGLWWLVWLVVVEYAALWWKNQRLPDVHDNLLSLAHAVLFEISRVAVRGLEAGVYWWLWDKYALIAPFDGSFAHVVAVILLIDFCYYWLHRASHEIMVLWAIHQVHHSGEEYTVAVGLRHSPLQRLFSWVFYLPLALVGVPPQHMLAHAQFNTLYQCWLHTEAIGTLGPLEYILNTPAHHRVHHGCNKYCLDKNYGGILLVWDHVFGTYQTQLPDQEIVYGIIFQPSFLNPLRHQVFYLAGALKKARSMDSWSNFAWALTKGPSWLPGAPWTGWDHDKVDIRGPRPHLKVNAGVLIHSYAILHFLAALSLTTHLAMPGSCTPMEVFLYSGVVVAALTAIGTLYEDPPYTRHVELARCVACLGLRLSLPLACTSTLTLTTYLYAASLLMWLLIPAKFVRPHQE